MKLVLALLLLSVSLPGWAHSHEAGEIQVRHPWSRQTAPGAKVGVGYMEIRNRGSRPDRLLAASTPLAARVEMHMTKRDGEVVRMFPVAAFEIPAGERLELRPGAGHLMLVDLTRALKKGERVPMTLRFEHAGELRIELEVQEMGSRHSRH
jgi:copper(I)-binding protein